MDIKKLSYEDMIYLDFDKNEIEPIAVAWDGCHKIYIIHYEKEILDAIKMMYEIHPMGDLENIWKNSCPLKFVSSWDLDVQYLKQGEKGSISKIINCI